MRITLIFIAITISIVACFSRHSTFGQSESKDRHKIWAAISVNEPVFVQGWTKNLQIYFTLVNDGSETVNPDISSSQIVVNGKAWEDSVNIFGNGIRDNRFEALPVGDYLLFTYALGDRFTTPGIYRVSWKGSGFESQEIIFRVLPQKPK